LTLELAELLAELKQLNKNVDALVDAVYSLITNQEMFFDVFDEREGR